MDAMADKAYIMTEFEKMQKELAEAKEAASQALTKQETPSQILLAKTEQKTDDVKQEIKQAGFSEIVQIKEPKEGETNQTAKPANATQKGEDITQLKKKNSELVNEVDNLHDKLVKVNEDIAQLQQNYDKQSKELQNKALKLKEFEIIQKEQEEEIAVLNMKLQNCDVIQRQAPEKKETLRLSYANKIRASLATKNPPVYKTATAIFAPISEVEPVEASQAIIKQSDDNVKQMEESLNRFGPLADSVCEDERAKKPEETQSIARPSIKMAVEAQPEVAKPIEASEEKPKQMFSTDSQPVETIPKNIAPLQVFTEQVFPSIELKPTVGLQQKLNSQVVTEENLPTIEVKPTEHKENPQITLDSAVSTLINPQQPKVAPQIAIETSVFNVETKQVKAAPQEIDPSVSSIEIFPQNNTKSVEITVSSIAPISVLPKENQPIPAEVALKEEKKVALATISLEQKTVLPTKPDLKVEQPAAPEKTKENQAAKAFVDKFKEIVNKQKKEIEAGLGDLGNKQIRISKIKTFDFLPLKSDDKIAKLLESKKDKLTSQIFSDFIWLLNDQNFSQKTKMICLITEKFIYILHPITYLVHKVTPIEFLKTFIIVKTSGVLAALHFDGAYSL